MQVPPFHDPWFLLCLLALAALFATGFVLHKWDDGGDGGAC